MIERDRERGGWDVLLGGASASQHSDLGWDRHVHDSQASGRPPNAGRWPERLEGARERDAEGGVAVPKG